MTRPRCITPECDRPAAIRDRCRLCYQQILHATGKASLADWDVIAPPVRVTAESLATGRERGQEAARVARSHRELPVVVVSAYNALEPDGTCPREEGCREAVRALGTRWACGGCPLVAGVCSTAGCGKPVKARGVCNGCHQAALRGQAARRGIVLDPPKFRPADTAPDPCRVPGCDRPSHVRGICRTHYNRAHQLYRFRGGDLAEWVEHEVARAEPAGIHGVNLRHGQTPAPEGLLQRDGEAA